MYQKYPSKKLTFQKKGFPVLDFSDTKWDLDLNLNEDFDLDP